MPCFSSTHRSVTIHWYSVWGSTRLEVKVVQLSSVLLKVRSYCAVYMSTI